MAHEGAEEDLLAPPKNCTVCGAVVSSWNQQHLCKACGASWVLVRNEKAENLAMAWFFGAVVLLMVLPLIVGLVHLGVAGAVCGYLAIRLKKQHRYRRVQAPGGD